MEVARAARRWDPSATPEGMPEAREKLVACVRALIDEHGVDPKRTIIGGFSQGAMITTDVALHHEVPFAGVAVLSGAHIRRDDWKAALTKTGNQQHIFQSHGRQDPILPFGVAEALHHAFVEAGATATFLPFDGGHEIRPRVVEGFSTFCRARLHDGERS
jgi:phospholipase/carboxylesterase